MCNPCKQTAVHCCIFLHRQVLFLLPFQFSAIVGNVSQNSKPKYTRKSVIQKTVNQVRTTIIQYTRHSQEMARYYLATKHQGQ